MIKLTRLDGSEVYLNPDLIEILEETPDTHITLSNGNSYIFLEPAKVVIGRIVSYRARVFRRVSSGGAKYLNRNDSDRYHPLCTL
jgi:flagellar protein FlbD